MALTLIHTLCSSLQHVRSLLNLLCLHQLLPGDGSNAVLLFCAHVFTGLRLSCNCLLIFELLSQDSSIMASGPCYIASAQTAQRTPLPTALLLLRMCLLQPLLSSGCCIADYFAVIAQQWVCVPYCSLVRLFILNSLQAYHHFFFSEGCACGVCDRPCLLSMWLSPCSATAPSACFLRSFVLSSSLIRCHAFRVYHRHPSFPRAAFWTAPITGFGPLCQCCL
jgi:hypothetical protein